MGCGVRRRGCPFPSALRENPYFGASFTGQTELFTIVLTGAGGGVSAFSYDAYLLRVSGTPASWIIGGNRAQIERVLSSIPCAESYSLGRSGVMRPSELRKILSN